MKNKYQEALDELRQLSVSKRQNELYEILQELIFEHEHNQMYTNCLACSTITKLELGETYALCPNCINRLERR